VAQLGLEQLQLLHLMSFSRRNPRSYLVVLHDPRGEANRELEFEVRCRPGAAGWCMLLHSWLQQQQPPPGASPAEPRRSG
jgi:hypothetical protein